MNSVIFDLDNTLYNWVDTIVPAIEVMVKEASLVTGFAEDRIVRDLRAVNVTKGTIEHPYSLLEAACIKEYARKVGASESRRRLDSAFYAFNKYRKSNLELYPGAIELLGSLRKMKFRIVAFTESRIEAAVDRLMRLELDREFDAIYCVRSVGFSDASLVADKFYSRIAHANIFLLDSDVRKPDPLVLRRIVHTQGLDPLKALYVGDSLIRDVGMANDAGLTSVWAKYGTKHDPKNMNFLLRITHWTDDEIRQTMAFEAATLPRPRYVLEDSPLQLVSEVLRLPM
ncbi:HAD family hydrolase [Hyphomonas sp.]|uniref:HAD family hydrolase n=1 Tax=Hyphomonas sp. TaxID=87 RepID=UPI00391C5E02